MSADTAPEVETGLAERAAELKARGAELKVKAAEAEERAAEASAWAVRLVSRLGEGSSLLGRRLLDRTKSWCLKGRREDLTGLSADLGIYVRGGLLIGATYGLYRAVYAHPGLMWPLVGGWCIAALRTQVKTSSTPTPTPTTNSGSQKDGSQTATQAGPRPSPDAFLHLLHDLVEEHSEGGRQTPGLHWPQVVAGLSSHYPGGGSEGGWSAADCRALCEGAGVPTSKGVRARGKGARMGVSTGVRTQDLPGRPPLPSPGPSSEGAPAPVVAVVSAGQDEQQREQQQQQQAENNSPGAHWSPAIGGWIVQDQENPDRYHVVRR
ncbi:hypothetical protein LVX13_10035 [Streptomyces albulus]|uniref:hypothetical protein n=1 Tax=Streptomyces noursei TaxID=1971 RepID=UPI001F472C4D|nr:hypothetical protein [Streptomyces noursei]MCE4943467.1 hypothetical protein [Streptomyces noursei]